MMGRADIPRRERTLFLSAVALAVVLFVATLSSLATAYHNVRDEAYQAFLAVQQQAALSLAERTDMWFSTLANAAVGIDSCERQPGHDWIDAEASHHGLGPKVHAYVFGPDGVLLARTFRAPELHLDHEHPPGDVGICPRCAEKDLLVFTSGGRGDGTVTAVVFPMAELMAMLKEEWAWMTDATGRIIGHYDTSQLGTHPFDADRDDPRLTGMLAEMAEGHTGTAMYRWVDPSADQAQDRLASFAPIHNGLPGWSIAISSPEADAMAGVSGSLNALAAATAGAFATVLLLATLAMLLLRRSHAAQEALNQERLLMTQTAAHADRLAMLGTMTAGVAHEIKNPLMALKGLGSLVRETCTCGVGEGPLVDHLERSINQLVAVSSDLTSYSRRQGDPNACEPARALQFATRLLGPDRGLKVKVAPGFDRLPRVTIGEQRLSQILLNLLSNALQSGERVEVGGDLRDGRVVITLDDDGPGISPTVQPHLFEPFATTRAPSEGTGLGLFLSRRFLDEAGGQIDAADSPLGGARFVVDLPVARDPLTG